jgi:hypothetical protein
MLENEANATKCRSERRQRRTGSHGAAGACCHLYFGCCGVCDCLRCWSLCRWGLLLLVWGVEKCLSQSPRSDMLYGAVYFLVI